MRRVKGHCEGGYFGVWTKALDVRLLFRCPIQSSWPEIVEWICPKYLLWCHSLAPKFPDAEGVVTFGEAAPLLIDGQFAVEPGWVWVIEGAVKQNLAGC
jgi:hypothetical protein